MRQAGAFGGATIVCMECIGQCLDFVRLIRTPRCPSKTYKIEALSAPIHTAQLVASPKRPRLPHLLVVSDGRYFFQRDRDR